MIIQENKHCLVCDEFLTDLWPCCGISTILFGFPLELKPTCFDQKETKIDIKNDINIISNIIKGNSIDDAAKMISFIIKQANKEGKQNEKTFLDG